MTGDNGRQNGRSEEIFHPKPPSLFLTAFEIQRALAELATLPVSWPLLRRMPKGDGHPVLVLPGFTASDISTAPLRRYLTRIGYNVFAWELGRNWGIVGDLEDRMYGRAQQIHDQTGQSISIIGWSLGGIYAREIARRVPHATRQVVTLGSPFATAGNGSYAVHIYDSLTGERVTKRRATLAEGIALPPPVPSTSIYSKTDGVAAWESCLEIESETTDNIEVPGSHCGLGFNPLVLYIVADRLAQPEGEWKPFDRSGARRFLYK
jgi:pimeloyl-ACP methyl ester carboxylesterase